MLIEGLPPDSALHRRYPQSRGWDNQEYLTADLVDAVQSLFNLTMAANSESGAYEPPEPLARPGDAERQAADQRQRDKRKASVLSMLEQLLPPERR